MDTPQTTLNTAIEQAAEFATMVGVDPNSENAPVQMSRLQAKALDHYIDTLASRNAFLGAQQARTADALARVQALARQFGEQDSATVLPLHIVGDMIVQAITQNPLPSEGHASETGL